MYTCIYMHTYDHIYKHDTCIHMTRASSPRYVVHIKTCLLRVRVQLARTVIQVTCIKIWWTCIRMPLTWEDAVDVCGAW